MLTRRRFFQALAASALAARVPLPIGLPSEVIPLPPGEYPATVISIRDGARGTLTCLIGLTDSGRIFSQTVFAKEVPFGLSDCTLIVPIENPNSSGSNDG